MLALFAFHQHDYLEIRRVFMKFGDRLKNAQWDRSHASIT
ncbi:hypothetical protein HMPREF9103_01913 [Lentilactobacillus parafarraginis F0439]|uniref:Uncharacterized protein n=1 Tax=Lentilactobacillus parafarraginis F0439 TaxID=797515 RepID=G9ZQA6_9LACO|nr:hypothetical protein HMPREF9103_01913 [Lentilactobacillus parafarraginis F0439]